MTSIAPITKRRRERPVLIGKVKLVAPYPSEAYFRLYTWSKDVWSRISDDVTPTDPAEYVAWQEAVDRAENVLTWGVMRGPELGGFIRFILDPAHPWMGEGHSLFKRDFWGRETTVPALVGVCRELFNDRGIKKLNMTTFPSNHAMKGLLKSIGARQEGEIRRVYQQGGKLVSAVIHGLIPEEMEEALRDNPSLEALCR